jgi:hypothetical protein
MNFNCSCYVQCNPTHSMCDFRLPPRSSLELRSSGLLHSLGYYTASSDNFLPSEEITTTRHVITQKCAVVPYVLVSPRTIHFYTVLVVLNDMPCACTLLSAGISCRQSLPAIGPTTRWTHLYLLKMISS